MTASLRTRLFIGAVFSLSFPAFSSAAPSAKIIGGTEVESASDYPWQVALFKNRTNFYQSLYCGGTLLGDRWILTAAHCAGVSTTTYVAAGIIDLTQTQSGEVAKVDRWFVHPDYNENTFDNDIALLRLEEPLNLSQCGDNCLAIDTVTTENEADLLYENATAIISGWGNRDASVNGEDFPSVLHFAEIYVTPCAGTGYSTDTAAYPVYPITNNMFCAGTSDFSRDTCQGDSGGPLVVFGNDQTPYLGGITSWGEGCAIDNFPGVYTRVSRFKAWIDSTMDANCCGPTLVAQDTNHRSKKDKDKFLGGMEWWVLAGLAGWWVRRGQRRR